MGFSESDFVDLLEGRIGIKSMPIGEQNRLMEQVQAVHNFLKLLEVDGKRYTLTYVLDFNHESAVIKFGFNFNGYKFPSFTLSVLFDKDNGIRVKGIDYDGSPLGIYFGRKKLFLRQVTDIALTALTAELGAMVDDKDLESDRHSSQT